MWDLIEDLTLDLPERPTEAASWAACDCVLDLAKSHPDDHAYIIATYLDAYARWLRQHF